MIGLTAKPGPAMEDSLAIPRQKVNSLHLSLLNAAPSQPESLFGKIWELLEVGPPSPTHPGES